MLENFYIIEVKAETGKINRSVKCVRLLPVLDGGLQHLKKSLAWNASSSLLTLLLLCQFWAAGSQT